MYSKRGNQVDIVLSIVLGSVSKMDCLATKIFYTLDSLNSPTKRICDSDFSKLTIFFFFLYSHKILQNRQLQDDTTGSMEIHSNPVAIPLNIFDSN